MKKKILILGNCVSKAIEETLKSSDFITKNFEVESPEKYIYQYTKDTTEALEVIEKIKGADVLIHMPINSKNFLGIDSNDMKKIIEAKRGKSICIPTPFFQGYWPESSFMRNHENVKIDSILNDFPQKNKTQTIHYFETVCLYYEAFGIEFSYKNDPFYMDNFFKKSFLEMIVNDSIENLRKREVKDQVDIPIADYIEKNFRRKKLFHTFNHPSSILIEYIVLKLLKMLNASTEETQYINVNESYVSYQQYPIYRSVHMNLNLSFNFTDCYVINFVSLSRQMFVEKHRAWINHLLKTYILDDFLPSSKSSIQLGDVLRRQFQIK